jgi:hypothetical protein
MTKGVQALIFTDCVSHGIVWQRSAGAYRIATELRRQGYTVQVIDYWSFLTLEGTDVVKGLLNKFVGTSTMFVGFSTTFFNTSNAIAHNKGFFKSSRSYNQMQRGGNAFATDYDILHEVAAHVKLLNPRADIITAGVRSTENDPIGTVRVVGYGEIHINDYLKWKSGKHPFFAPRIDGKVRVLDYNSKAEGFDFANSSIDWHPNDCIQPEETLPIEISRGCIFRCKFCSFPLNGKSKVDYLKEIEILRGEFLRNYELFGTTRYIFADDTYNDTTAKLEWMNEVQKGLPFKVTFGTYIRLDLIAAHREQAELLLENGLTAAFFGIESLNTASSRSIGKGMPSEKIVDTLHWLREDVWGHRVLTTGGTILGLPHDTYETMTAWMERLIDHRFPLHNFEFAPLGITDKNKIKRTFYSEFDEDPGKFGYTLHADGTWTNDKYGTTFQGCNELGFKAYTYAMETGRLNFSSHVVVSITDYGYTHEDLLLMSRRGCMFDSALYSRVYGKYINYVQALFKVETE